MDQILVDITRIGIECGDNETLSGEKYAVDEMSRGYCNNGM